MRSVFEAFVAEQDGVTAVEYGVITAAIAATVAAAWAAYGEAFVAMSQVLVDNLNLGA